LTIARVRSGRNKEALAKCIRENADVDFGVIRAACLRLKSSDLTPRGPIYATLKEYCP
jgi:2'-5' RNA ligase